MTQQYAVQVSDRRLVWRGSRIADDHQNKNIILNGAIAFGYAGRAELDGQRTDRWLTRYLAGNRSLTAALDVVAERATPALNRAPYSERLLAVCGVGWVAEDDGVEIRPVICRVSNYADPANPRPASVAIQSVVLRPNELVRWAVEGPPLKELEKDLRHRLKRYAQTGASADQIVKLLVGIIRRAAERDSNVGRNLLSVVIPRRAVLEAGRMTFASTGPPVPNGITFQAWPDGVSPGCVWGPNMASRSGAAITDFRGGPLPPTDARDLGGLTLSTDGRKTIAYPCCVLRRRGSNSFLTLTVTRGTALPVFTESEILNSVLSAKPEATPFYFSGSEELVRFLESMRNRIRLIYWNPGGTDFRSGTLPLERVVEILREDGLA